MSLRFSLVLVAVTGLISPETEAAPSAPGGTQHAGALLSEDSSGLALPLQLVVSGEDPEAMNQMGAAMEVAGDYLFIAAPGDGDGRVDVWYRGPSGYFFAQRLSMPPQLAGLDNQFGRSLAADGSVLVVGTKTSNDSGRAVVFRRHGISLYSFEKILEPSTGHPSHGLFAEHLSVIEGELIAVSARGELAVHVFEADASGNFPSTSTRILNQVNTGTTPSMSWMTSFGSTVGLHRTGQGLVSILVGMEDACFYQRTQMQAPDEVTPDPSGATAARTGGVAVLRKSGGAWQLAQRLVPDWSKMKDFGFEVNADGPYVAVGAIYSKVFSNGLEAGSASVYRWNGSQFALVKTVAPAVPIQNGWFGYSVELRDNHLLVGQPHLWGGPQGLVQVFRITANDVYPVALLIAPDGNPAASSSSLGDCFGREIVSNSYGEVIIAAPFSAPGSGTSSQYGGGAVYVYR